MVINKGLFMNKKSLRFNFDISTDKNTSYTPLEFNLKAKMTGSKTSTLNESTKPPLKYFNDALIAMNFHTLNQFKNCNPSDQKFINTYLQSIDPYFELFNNSSFRLKKIISETSLPKKQIIQKFEKDLTNKIDAFFSNTQINFKSFSQVLKDIDQLEKNLEQNLIYNFNIKFSEEFNQKLISYYSFLFHARSLSAHFYNKHIEDSTFESIKCDSINDYLSKADFTVNDALVYWQFKKLSTPFNSGRDMKIEKLFIQPLENAFLKYNSNACTLINSLPESFLTHQNSTLLEESLHQVQMDWLLGSGSGLLFRIREECFGLVHGYDQIFWQDSDSSYQKTSENVLQFQGALLESDFIITTKAG